MSDTILSSFFTEYDDSLSAGILRDPLGFQVIWSTLGKRIFNNKITSISTDIRNFTINLFNHYIVKTIEEDFNIQIHKNLAEFYVNKSHNLFKTSLIIFLENLLVYSFIENTENKNINIEGLLGSSNAANKYKKNNKIDLKIIVNDEVLVRQIQLGINGRYKTPFMLMNFFDDNYNYNPKDNPWDIIEKLFSKWKPVLNLKTNLINLIANMISTDNFCMKEEYSSKQKFTIAFIPLKEISESIKNLYIECFGDTINIPNTIKKEFWIKHLGLDTEPAKTLYDIVANIKKYYISNNKDIFKKSNKVNKQKDDRIINIIKLEPFLSKIDFLFRSLCIQDIRNLEDYSSFLNEKEFNINPKKEELRTIIAEDSEAKERLKKLLDIDFSDIKKCAKQLFKYHQDIMKFRGLPAWFSINGNKIKHYSRVYKRNSIIKRNPDTWIHSYYIDTLNSIAKGIEN